MGQHLAVVLFEKLTCGDEQTCFAVAEHIGQLSGRDPGVHADHDRANRADGKVGNDPLNAVAHQDGHLVTFADAVSQQTRSHGIDRNCQLRVAQSLLAADQCFAVGKAHRHLCDQGWNGAAARCSGRG